MPEQQLRDCALVVLAGGRGTRLGGVIKPLLEFADGETMLARIERTFAPLVGSTLIVAPRDQHEALRTSTQAKLIADEGEGPAAALLVAAQMIDTTWMLVVGGDQPRPSLALASRLRAGATGDAIVIRDASDHIQPFPALYATEALRRLPAAKGMAFHALLTMLAPTPIAWSDLSEDERAAFDDVDTREAMNRSPRLRFPGSG